MYVQNNARAWGLSIGCLCAAVATLVSAASVAAQATTQIENTTVADRGDEPPRRTRATLPLVYPPARSGSRTAIAGEGFGPRAWDGNFADGRVIVASAVSSMSPSGRLTKVRRIAQSPTLAVPNPDDPPGSIGGETVGPGELVSPSQTGRSQGSMPGAPFGSQLYDSDAFGHDMVDDGQPDFVGDPSCCDACGACGACDECDCCCHDPCCHSWLWQNFSSFGGAQGFKGPPDQGSNGNFGFHKGVNWGIPVWSEFGIGGQLGAVYVASDFEGGRVIPDSRNQIFVTTGLYRRAPYGQGFQGGVVADYLHDDYYVTANLAQVRSELSVRGPFNGEVGVWSAVHTRPDRQFSHLSQTFVTWQATDLYAFFYRQYFETGAIGRLWVGFSGNGGALFGGDATVPFTESLGLQAAYNYVTPNDHSDGAIRETWGLTLSLVWYPSSKMPNGVVDSYRPLFNVADNSSFMVNMK